MENEQLIYPVDPWTVSEDSLDAASSPGSETVFSVANGYVGVRGAVEEGLLPHRPGLFLNGFYETEPIVYGESAYGFATHHQRMLTLGDPTVIRLRVNGSNLVDAELHEFERSLDLKTGILSRMSRWHISDGAEIRVRAERMVSFRRQHLIAIEWECTAERGSGRIEIDSIVQGRPVSRSEKSDPRRGHSFSRNALLLGKREADERLASIRYRTRNTEFDVVMSVANVIETEVPYERQLIRERDAVGHRFELSMREGESVRISKLVATYTSLDDSRSRLTGLVRQDVESARRARFPGLVLEQKSFLEGFWDRSDVVIEGDDTLQQSIRFNLFHLIQATGRNGRTSVAAKGLTGAGYEGHYFWDTEIYVMPFLTYTNPGIARALLLYRYRTLAQARDRAAVLGHPGALYPWRTINGEEASAYFPAGTAQYHINADIVYALRKYVQVSGDRWFLLKRGAEMLFETARFWRHLGCFVDGKGFCINEVTGPDEYTALVNNNVYTNLMAADHLEYAASVYHAMADHDRAMLDPLVDRIGLDQSEVAEWRRAAEQIYVPYDAARRLHPQNDGFLDLEPWDFEKTPRSDYPLLLHYHPLNIYRRQVLKQPDLVLALFLQGHRFSLEEKRRDFHYYDPLTTGDSSLAPCVQSIVAAEIGETELAYRYFMKTARMDLDNVNGNVADGVHTAAMAGTWLSLTYGFGGMRDRDGNLRFSPALPAAWDRLQFRVLWRGTLLEVDIRSSGATYRLPRGGRLEFMHRDDPVALSGSDPHTISN